MKTLHLTLTRRWFNEIQSGRKTAEYRDDTEYWNKRLINAFIIKKVHTITFRAGYANNAPKMVVEWLGLVKIPSKNAPDGWKPKTEDVNMLLLGKIIETHNINN